MRVCIIRFLIDQKLFWGNRCNSAGVICKYDKSIFCFDGIRNGNWIWMRGLGGKKWDLQGNVVYYNKKLM